MIDSNTIKFLEPEEVGKYAGFSIYASKGLPDLKKTVDAMVVEMMEASGIIMFRPRPPMTMPEKLLLEAGKILNAAPIPTKGRKIYDPRSNSVIDVDSGVCVPCGDDQFE